MPSVLARSSDAAALAPPFFGAARKPHAPAGPLVAGAAVLAPIETAIALLALAVVLIVANAGSLPEDLEGFLAARLTAKNVLLLIALGTGWPLIFRGCGLYHDETTRDAAAERWRVVHACSLGTVLALTVPLLSRGGLSIGDLGAFWLTTTAGTLAVREVRQRVVRASHAERRVLIVGTGARGYATWQALARLEPRQYHLVGFVDTPDAVPAAPEVARHTIGRLDGLETLLMHEAIDEVFVALPVKSRYAAIQETISVCERVGVRAKYRADLFDSRVAWPGFDAPNGPTVTLYVAPDDYRVVIKRLIDIAGASAALLVLGPLMLVVAGLVKAAGPGPVLFRQERYGFNRRRFRMLKFRTMVPDAERLQVALESRNEAEGPVFKIADDPRVTRLGRVLRRTSIDELPQLFNVLRGEMSLVGPRPLPLRDVTRFTQAGDMRRFSVHPGLTCLWQISGRSNLGFSDWVRLDLAYIDRWSLALDLMILLRTVPAVLRGTGAR